MFSGEIPEPGLRIKIIGVGGAGTNAVDRLKLDNLAQVDLAGVNTDLQALSQSPLPEKVMIGRGLTRGMSCGGEVALGREAAEKDRPLLEKLVLGSDLVFLVAGLGGGTGSGAAPVLAKAASDEGALVIAFVMLPFTFEGGRKKKIAEDALAELRRVCDAVIPLPNDVLLQTEGEEATVLNAFGKADIWIRRGVAAICNLLLRTGLINQDFTSLRRVFSQRGGKTLFGLGTGSGPESARMALQDLLLCPLLHTPEFTRRADNLLVHITGGPDLTITKVNEIMAALTEKFGSRENTVFGALIDDSLHEQIEIVAIGTASPGGKGWVRPPAAALSRNVPVRPEPVAVLPAQIPAAPGGRTEPVGKPFDLEGDPEEEAAPDLAGGAPAEPFPVHESKLKAKSRQQSLFDQDQFRFTEMDEQRGYFDKTARNLYDGEDLDVPTFLRKGIKVSLKE